jgi:peptidoglycan/xylan/chitin deacetylase (PgdA/CDA1 family)
MYDGREGGVDTYSCGLSNVPGLVHHVARIVRHVRGLDVPASPVRCRDDLDDPLVALTFDDGPSEWTEAVLDTLRDTQARATFFVIGEAIPGREGTLRRISIEGHEVGNHTMTHRRLAEASRRAITHEIRQANRAVEKVIGAPPTVFRPPGFGYNVAVLEVARSAGFGTVVLSSATTDDYLRESAAEIVEAILPRVRPGAIIDLHDGRPPRESPLESRADRWPTVEATGLLIDALRDYSFVTVSELLAR